MKMKNRFEEIAESAIDAAQHVKCPIKQYQDGLQLIIDELSMTLDASREIDRDTPDDEDDED